jgi:uncharacterized membrane protein
MAVLYVLAGTLHFVITPRYMAIMPPYLPAHHALVLISGGAEIAGGFGVLSPSPVLRRIAAWGIVALLIAVLPANVYMLTGHQNFPGIRVWIAWLRLPLQLPLIYWAWRYTKDVRPIP